MVQKEIVDYLKEGMEQGVSLIVLKGNLLDSGWSEKDVGEAIDSLGATKVKSGFYSQFTAKNFLLVFVGFFILVGIILLISFIVQNKGESYSAQQLKEGVSVDMRRAVVNLEYSDGKTKKAQLLSANTLIAKVDIGGRQIEFEMGENKTLDLDLDGSMDIVVTYQSINGNVPTFFIKLLERVFVEDSQNQLIIRNQEDFDEEENVVANVTDNNTEECIEEWVCTDWGPCIDDLQSRVCGDSNDCGTLLLKPIVNRACIDEDDSNDSSDDGGTGGTGGDTGGDEEEPVCMEGKTACYEPQGFICEGEYDSQKYNPYCCSGSCVEFVSKENYCSVRSDEFNSYFYFESNESHFCSDSSNFPFNGTTISCCKNNSVLEHFNSTKYIADSVSLCGEGYTYDCGVTNLSDSEKVVYFLENYGAMNSTLFGKDCSMVCFDNALRDNCSSAKVGINFIDEEGRNDSIFMESLGELPDGNCSVNFTVERYNITYPEDLNLNNTSLNCPFSLNNTNLDNLGCLLFDCPEMSLPGSSVLGLSFLFEILISNDLENDSGCYGEIVELTDNITVIF